jgi:hypothetical protein
MLTEAAKPVTAPHTASRRKPAAASGRTAGAASAPRWSLPRASSAQRMWYHSLRRSLEQTSACEGVFQDIVRSNVCFTLPRRSGMLKGDEVLDLEIVSYDDGHVGDSP